MLHKTESVALSYLKYRESSIIARLFTRKFGLQSYIINGVRSTRKHSGRLALFQPFVVCEIVAYHKPRTGLQRLSQIQVKHFQQSIPYDAQKSAVAIFLCELLGKSLPENEPHEKLFLYVERAIRDLDATEELDLNFHLKFMIEISTFLGFGIPSGREVLHQIRDFSSWSNSDQIEYSLDRLINREEVVLGNKIRRTVLDCLVQFYQIQLEHIGNLKSLRILQAIMAS